MSEEALRRARQGLNALRLEVDGRIVTDLTALVEAAFAALSEGQAPEPVAQEPYGWFRYSLDGQFTSCSSNTDGAFPLYTHPAGMDAARAKAIEPHPSQGPWCLFLNKHCTRMCCDYCNAYETDRADRALATKGAGS